MKTFKDFINEKSYTARGIGAYLVSKGYKRLGAGLDATAYLEPNGTVLKIFGTEKGSTYKTHSASQKMFKSWVTYCERHSDNKFLPVFHGWEGFEWDQQNYLQIRMEKYDALDHSTGIALQNFFSYRAVHKDKFDREKYKNQFLSGRDLDTNSQNVNQGTAKLAMLLGEKDFIKLYDTIAEVADFGRAKGYGIDLHYGNFMQRKDGTPVIVDPFTAD